MRELACKVMWRPRRTHLLKNFAVASCAVALVIAIVAIRSFFSLYGWNFEHHWHIFFRGGYLYYTHVQLIPGAPFPRGTVIRYPLWLPFVYSLVAPVWWLIGRPVQAFPVIMTPAEKAADPHSKL